MQGEDCEQWAAWLASTLYHTPTVCRSDRLCFYWICLHTVGRQTNKTSWSSKLIKRVWPTCFLLMRRCQVIHAMLSTNCRDAAQTWSIPILRQTRQTPSQTDDVIPTKHFQCFVSQWHCREQPQAHTHTHTCTRMPHLSVTFPICHSGSNANESSFLSRFLSQTGVQIVESNEWSSREQTEAVWTVKVWGIHLSSVSAGSERIYLLRKHTLYYAAAHLSQRDGTEHIRPYGSR